ncbi:hypothetical protein [Altericista sp. CCNU0014]|uniref:hypothetical protein n=1 Tax=Altericista sp. CCNU0014 TaxID=3082949 RepID=UPI00384EE382
MEFFDPTSHPIRPSQICELIKQYILLEMCRCWGLCHEHRPSQFHHYSSLRSP